MTEDWHLFRSHGHQCRRRWRGNRKHQVMKAYHLLTSSCTFWFCLGGLEACEALSDRRNCCRLILAVTDTWKQGRFIWHVTPHVVFVNRNLDCWLEKISSCVQREQPGCISSHCKKKQPKQQKAQNLFATCNSHNKSYTNRSCKMQSKRNKKDKVDEYVQERQVHKVVYSVLQR